MPNTSIRRSARRFVVTWGRQLHASWVLWAAGLLASLALGLGGWTSLALGILGLGIAWEVAGRAASSYSEIHDDRWRNSPGCRSLTVAASIAVALAYFVLTLRLVNLLFADSRVPMVVVAATLLGGWMVFCVFRQWWRAIYGICGVMLISAFSAYSIANASDAPDSFVSTGIAFFRLCGLWLVLLGVFWFAPYRGSDRSRSASWMRMAWLAPAQICAVSLVLCPMGEDWGNASPVNLWLLLLGGQIVLVVLMFVFRATRMHWDMTAIGLWMGRINSTVRHPSAALVVGVAAVPAFAASAVSGWSEWLLVATLVTAAAIMIVWLFRMESNTTCRLDVGHTDRSDHANFRRTEADRASPPPVLTLS